MSEPNSPMAPRGAGVGSPLASVQFWLKIFQQKSSIPTSIQLLLKKKTIVTKGKKKGEQTSYSYRNQQNQ